ncbi:hypothetical protein T07_294 [Trichinella nelsoni]|uniref:Uncharacterized protein n=1 Tax=Trichinella nelsoni TaxID=6336 RepID=A0A0V0SJP6_9BILA|nr:hypothetical protein T07_294 [Trichinella nelsoni]
MCGVFDLSEECAFIVILKTNNLAYINQPSNNVINCSFLKCSDDSHDVKVMPTTTCYDTIFVVKRLCFCISRVIGRPQSVDILLVQFCFSIFGKKKNSRPCTVDHLFARKWVTGSAVMQQNMAIDSGHTGAETVCRNRCQSPQRFSSAGCDM